MNNELEPKLNINEKITEALKVSYIKSGIKISDDDPMIAVLLAHSAMIDVYNEIVMDRLSYIERGLSEFPVKVREDLEKRSSNLIEMLELGSSSLQNSIDEEIKNSQDKINDYSESMVKLVKNKLDNIKPENTPKKHNIFNYILICFLTSILGSSISIFIAYKILTS